MRLILNRKQKYINKSYIPLKDKPLHFSNTYLYVGLNKINWRFHETWDTKQDLKPASWVLVENLISAKLFLTILGQVRFGRIHFLITFGFDRNILLRPNFLTEPQNLMISCCAISENLLIILWTEINFQQKDHLKIVQINYKMYFKIERVRVFQIARSLSLINF